MNRINYKTMIDLHSEATPLILYNCWSAQSAKIIEKSGAKMNATSSYALADSLGYDDGEKLPFKILLDISAEMVKQTNIPLSVDMETGYGESNEMLKNNILALLKVGVVGINLEDRIIGNAGYELRDIVEQVKRIIHICNIVGNNGYNLFINARTDIFFKEAKHDLSTIELAIKRSNAYYKAGAKCFFVPGLTDINLIETLVKNSPLPINVMLSDGSPTIKELTEAGVKRISYGPFAYFDYVRDLETRVGKVYVDKR